MLVEDTCGGLSRLEPERSFVVVDDGPVGGRSDEVADCDWISSSAKLDCDLTSATGLFAVTRSKNEVFCRCCRPLTLSPNDGSLSK